MTSAHINDLQAIRRALFNGQKSAAKTDAQEAFERVVKRIADIDLLDEWIVSEGGLFHRTHDTGRGIICCTVCDDRGKDREYFGEDAPQARGRAAEALQKNKGSL